MRLFTKYFLFGMLVLGLAFSASGYFLLHYSMESSLAREAEFALKQYQYDKFTVQSAMLTYADVSVMVSDEDGLFSGDGAVFSMWGFFPVEAFPGEVQVLPGNMEVEESGTAGGAALFGSGVPGNGEEIPKGQAEEQEFQEKLVKSLFASLVGEISVPVAFYAEDGTVVYSEIEGFDVSFLGSLAEDAHVYQFWDSPKGGCVLVGSVLYFDHTVLQGGTEAVAAQPGAPDRLRKVYFITQWDISKTILQQQTLRQYFIRCYLVAMAAGMVLLGFLSALLTGPLKRMSKAAGRMAEGDYEARLAISGKDEIGELAGSFNRMADAVEEKIGELSRAAREKEDFVANFAHELKTPLTSIIGYADTIYQKELSREEVRKASWHIWNEGMRLEALSFKLMELTVLGKQEFPLVEMPAEELLRDVAEGLAPLMEEKQAELCLQAQAAYIRVDYDLLKTLLINLVDNSVKAGATRIELAGELKPGTGYSGEDGELNPGAGYPGEAGGLNPVAGQPGRGRKRNPVAGQPGRDTKRRPGAGHAEAGTDEEEGAGLAQPGGMAEGEMYRIRVRDNGCGMEEEVLSRITEAFYMVDKARSRRQHGAGLGLALADRIARVHGSELVFRSRAGKGTEVSFFLKCERGAAKEGEIWPDEREGKTEIGKKKESFH